MYYPYLEIVPGNSIYSWGIESEIVIAEVLSNDGNRAIVKFAGYAATYSIMYCYSSLAYGPYWMIEPKDYTLPRDYTMEEYWKFTNKIYEISAF
jgi:hypothetical protein